MFLPLLKGLYLILPHLAHLHTKILNIPVQSIVLTKIKNTQTFLSPTTKELQRSIEKAASAVKVVYNTNELKDARKNILQSVDHILGHDLVKENPQAAAFVAELERKVQEIKEEFTKSVHSITCTMQGNDDELTFPAFQSRKRKYVDKRYKGLSG
jgi:hypothetical protein